MTSGQIDSDGTRHLLGGINGDLLVLQAKMSGSEVESLSVDRLGQTTIASSLTYIDNGFVFIGSALGDSQVRINFSLLMNLKGPSYSLFPLRFPFL